MDALAPFSTEKVADEHRREPRVPCRAGSCRTDDRHDPAKLTHACSGPGWNFPILDSNSAPSSLPLTISPCHPFHRPVEPYLRLQCVRVLTCCSLARTFSFSSQFPRLLPSLCIIFEVAIISRWNIPDHQNAFRYQGHRSLSSQREGWRKAPDPRREVKASGGAFLLSNLGLQ